MIGVKKAQLSGGSSNPHSRLTIHGASALTTLRQQAGVVETYNEKIMNPVHRVCLECESEYRAFLLSCHFSLSLFLSRAVFVSDPLSLFGSLIEGGVSPFLFPVSTTYPLALFQTFWYSLATTISISSSLPLLTSLSSLFVVAIQKSLSQKLPASEPTTSAMQITVPNHFTSLAAGAGTISTTSPSAG